MRGKQKVKLLQTLAHCNGTAHTGIHTHAMHSVKQIQPTRSEQYTMKNEINVETFFTYYGRIAIFYKSLSEQINACTILTLVTVAFFFSLSLNYFVFYLLGAGEAV